MQYFKEAKCVYSLTFPVDFTGGLYPCLDDTYICSSFLSLGFILFTLLQQNSVENVIKRQLGRLINRLDTLIGVWCAACWLYACALCITNNLTLMGLFTQDELKPSEQTLNLIRQVAYTYRVVRMGAKKEMFCLN